jgi:hypothetical protein
VTDLLALALARRSLVPAGTPARGSERSERGGRQ